MTLSLWTSGTPANGTGQGEDGHAIERRYLQDLELEAATIRSGTIAIRASSRLRLEYRVPSGEPRSSGALPQLLEECLVGTADRLQLGAGIGEQRIGDVDEFGEIHALGDPVEAADDHGAARQRTEIDRSPSRQQ